VLHDWCPKKVKKTFVERMSSAELDGRLRGSAVSGLNTPGWGSAPVQPARAVSRVLVPANSGEEPGRDRFRFNGGWPREINSLTFQFSTGFFTAEHQLAQVSNWYSLGSLTKKPRLWASSSRSPIVAQCTDAWRRTFRCL